MDVVPPVLVSKFRPVPAATVPRDVNVRPVVPPPLATSLMVLAPALGVSAARASVLPPAKLVYWKTPPAKPLPFRSTAPCVSWPKTRLEVSAMFVDVVAALPATFSVPPAMVVAPA